MNEPALVIMLDKGAWFAWFERDDEAISDNFGPYRSFDEAHTAALSAGISDNPKMIIERG